MLAWPNHLPLSPYLPFDDDMHIVGALMIGIILPCWTKGIGVGLTHRCRFRSSVLSRCDHPEGLYALQYPGGWNVELLDGKYGLYSTIVFSDPMGTQSFQIEPGVNLDFEYDLDIDVNRKLFDAVQKVSGFSPVADWERRDDD